MATINSDGKVAYIYNADDDTWYAISGAVNTNQEYTWTADQTFSGATFEAVVTAQGGVNNFQNPTARNAAITSPTNGIVCFIRQTDAGEVLNQIQYYYNGAWKSYDGYANLSTQTGTYTLQLTDAGKTITVNEIVGDPMGLPEISIPANSSVAFPIGTRIDIVNLYDGTALILPTSGVTVHSNKGTPAAIADQYSGATLLKIDTNTWVLIGNLVYAGTIVTP